MEKQTSLTPALALGVTTAIPYNKHMRSAHMLELPFTPAGVERTILKRLRQIGYMPNTQGHLFWKMNSSDGFYIFNNVMLPSHADQKLDIYFKVVQKNHEEKNNSTLYMLVSNGNERFSSPERDTVLWQSSELFLNGFLENDLFTS